MAKHINALPVLASTARLQRLPACSHSHAAIVALPPRKVI
jgi:hypothetical protein